MHFVILTSLLFLLDSMPAPARVPLTLGYDFQGQHTKLIHMPPFKNVVVVQPTEQATFLLHARIEHDSSTGLSIHVWVTPGMDEGDASYETCTDVASHPGCFTDPPEQMEVQRLFTRTLNTAILVNQNGFGQYLVTACDGPPTNSYAWLHVRPRVALVLDPRHDYSVITSSCRTHSVPETWYELTIDHVKDEYSAARFVPTGNKALGAETLNYISRKCRDGRLDDIVFATRLRTQELRESTAAHNAPSF